MRYWPGRPQGVLQELQLREEGLHGVEHAGQPDPDVHLGEEAIVGEEPREVDEGKDVEIKDEVVVKQTDCLEEKLPADVRIPVILGHVEAVWVTPAKWVEGIVEMVTQVEAKLQGMPIEALNLVEVELGGSENNDETNSDNECLQLNKKKLHI